MDWVERLNTAVNYIDENLSGEISFERISEIVGCSIYNFQRMFSYFANKPLSEYIRQRRLTMAAFDLINSKDKIIDIAVKYGYDSHDSFTRAFKRFHGVLPSMARSETVGLKNCPRISFEIAVKGETYMSYKIKHMPAFAVCGFKRKVSIKEASVAVPQLRLAAEKDGTIAILKRLIRNFEKKPSGFLGINTGSRWSYSEKLDYYIGVADDIDITEGEGKELSEELNRLEFPEATWVILEANGKLPNAVQEVYKSFYTEWLPGSGYWIEELPIIECYIEENRQEVWVAVKPISNRI